MLISILTEQLENEQTSPDNKSEASQQSSEQSAQKTNIPKQEAQTDEEMLAEDLLKSCLQASAANEICMKNKVNPVGTEDVKLMEL